MICVSDEHSENAPPLIVLMNDGIIAVFTFLLVKTSVSKISLVKFLLKMRNLSSMYSIRFTLQISMDILFNFRQRIKIESPIEVTDDGIVICVSDEHP